MSEINCLHARFITILLPYSWSYTLWLAHLGISGFHRFFVPTKYYLVCLPVNQIFIFLTCYWCWREIRIPKIFFHLRKVWILCVVSIRRILIFVDNVRIFNTCVQGVYHLPSSSQRTKYNSAIGLFLVVSAWALKSSFLFISNFKAGWWDGWALEYTLRTAKVRNITSRVP